MNSAARQTLDAVLRIWNGATPDLLDRLLASAYRGHMLGVPGGERDGAGYTEAIQRFRLANPGVVVHIVEQFDAGDRCVSRLEARRPGVEAGASFVSHGINIARFDERGLLAEEWAIWSPWGESTSGIP